MPCSRQVFVRPLRALPAPVHADYVECEITNPLQKHIYQIASRHDMTREEIAKAIADWLDTL